MGLSIAIAGAIVMFSLVYAMMSFPAIIDDTTKISKASTDIATLENSRAQTNLSISSIDSALLDTVDFTVSDSGNAKLWNFKHFDVIVTYDGGIVTKTIYTDNLSYKSTCTGAAGTWCINQITGDSIDPGILNTGESAKIQATLDNNLFATNKTVSIIITTDNGITATKSEVVP